MIHRIPYYIYAGYNIDFIMYVRSLYTGSQLFGISTGPTG